MDKINFVKSEVWIGVLDKSVRKLSFEVKFPSFIALANAAQSLDPQNLGAADQSLIEQNLTAVLNSAQSSNLSLEINSSVLSSQPNVQAPAKALDLTNGLGSGLNSVSPLPLTPGPANCANCGPQP